MHFEKWNKFDTALLLKAYLELKVDNNEQNFIVSSLSTALRKKAVFLGRDIEENFRNEAGIRWQLTYIDKAFNNIDDSRIPNNFKFICELYKNDKEYFIQIYNLAKILLSNSNIYSHNFFDWFVTINKNKRINMVQLYYFTQDITDYAIKNGYANHHIFHNDKENFDDYKKLLLILKNSSIYQETYNHSFDEIDFLDNIISQYYELVNIKEVKKTTKDRNNYEEDNNSKTSFIFNYKEKRESSIIKWYSCNFDLRKKIDSINIYFKCELIINDAPCKKSTQTVKIMSNCILIDNVIAQYLLDFEYIRMAIDGSNYVVEYDYSNFKKEMHESIFSVIDDMVSIGPDNVIYVKGTVKNLELFYEHFSNYCINLQKHIFKLKFRELIKNNVIGIPNAFKQVDIHKFFDRKDIIRVLHKNNIYKLKDFMIKKYFDLNIEDILYIYKSLSGFTYVLPYRMADQLIAELQPMMKEVLERRCMSINSSTLEEIGEEYNVTRERIRQVEKRAKNILFSDFNKKKWNIIIDNIFLISSYAHLVKSTSNNFSILRLLASQDLIYSWNEDLFFKNKNLLEIIIKQFDKIPEGFYEYEKEELINEIYDDINGRLTKEEILLLIESKYKQYGIVYAKGKMNVEYAINFLMPLYFPDGIRIYNNEDLNLLRKKAKENFNGLEIGNVNHNLQSKLQRYCIPIERGLYILDTEKKKIPDELVEDIEDYIKNSESPIISLNALYDEFGFDLRDNNIENIYQLSLALKKCNSFNYRIYKSNVFKNDRYVSDELYDFIANSETPVTKQEIFSAFPYLAESTILQALDPRKIVNMRGLYVVLEQLDISKDEKSQLKFDIDNLIADGKIHNFKNIYSLSRQNNKGLFERIGLNHYEQLYSLVRALYPDEYEYSRPYIAMKGIIICAGDEQITKKMLKYNEITLEQIKEISVEVGKNIGSYIEFIDSRVNEYIFKDRETLIKTSVLGLNDYDFDNIDNIIDRYLRGKNYAGLSEFCSYWELPNLKIKWNMWVLYSIINLYSDKYEAIMSDGMLSAAVPLVVNVDYRITDEEIKECARFSSNEIDLIDYLDFDDLM